MSAALICSRSSESKKKISRHSDCPSCPNFTNHYQEGKCLTRYHLPSILYSILYSILRVNKLEIKSNRKNVNIVNYDLEIKLL